MKTIKPINAEEFKKKMKNRGIELDTLKGKESIMEWISIPDVMVILNDLYTKIEKLTTEIEIGKIFVEDISEL